jgi:hypothetical protein
VELGARSGGRGAGWRANLAGQDRRLRSATGRARGSEGFEVGELGITIELVVELVEEAIVFGFAVFEG